MKRSPRPGPSSVLCYPGRRSCSRPLPKQGKNVLSLDKSLFKRQGCYSRHWEVPIFSSYHSTPRRFHPISTRLWAFSLRDPSKPPFSNPSHQRGVNPKCLSSSKRDKKKVPCNTESLAARCVIIESHSPSSLSSTCGKLSVFPIFGMVPIGPTTVFQPPVLPSFQATRGTADGRIQFTKSLSFTFISWRIRGWFFGTFHRV